MISFDSSMLTAYRSQADALADTIMQTVLRDHAEMRVNALFEMLAYNDSFETAGLPEPLEEFLRNVSQLPSWYDADKVTQGEEVFAKYGMEICIILLCKSLPECYLCWRGATVLFETGRLMEQKGDLSRLTRRVAETLQFVVNVMAKGGTAPNGKGIITAQKIRLIHATIRTFIRQHPWDTEELGEPINQEDLALTLTTFSSSVLEGLSLLGIFLSEKEQTAYMHCWRVIGYIMGVDEVFLTDSYNDAKALQKAILDVQAGSTPENIALAQSCVDFIEYIIPAKHWKGIAPIMMKFFLGKKYAKMLSIRTRCFSLNTVRFALVRFALTILGFGEQHSRVVQGIVSLVGNDVIQGLVLYFNDYKQIQFSLPLSLRETWKLTTPKK